MLLGCALPVQSNPSQELMSATRGQKLPQTAQFTFNRRTIRLEVARTATEQSTGLMSRTNLPRNRGMLFVFSPPRAVKFWMKDTLIPLDMIFMSNGIVKYIGAKIPPCQADPCASYGPATGIEIDNVIELRSGRAAQLQLKVGDKIKVRYFGNI